MSGTFRITHPTALVLVSIGRGCRYGFDIMEATGLPSGTVYPILRRLEAADALASTWEEPELSQEEGRPRRKNYELTALGNEALASAEERLARHAGLLGPHGASVESGGRGS